MKRTRLYKYNSIKDVFYRLLILFFFLLPLVLSLVVSKFLYDWSGNSHNILSQNFFFLSDSLANADIKSAEPIIMFELKNYNDNFINQSDIKYKVQIFNNNQEVENLSCTITNFSNSSTSGTENISNQGILSGKTKSRNIVNISGFPLNNGQAITYTVEVSSSEPYSKTLTADYNITHLSDYELAKIDISTLSPYVFVTINANDFEGTKNFRLTWDSTKVIPDNTDSKLQNITETSEADFLLQRNMSDTYRFIAIGDNISDLDFNLTQISS